MIWTANTARYRPVSAWTLAFVLAACVAFQARSMGSSLLQKYDDLNRLTRVDYGNGDYIQYTYDEVGNRTSMASYQIARLAAIEAAKEASDNRAVEFGGGGYVVTASFPNCFYIERDNRSCGIRVEREKHGIAVGQKATVVGAIRTNGHGERYIDADLVSPAGNGSVKPLGMSVRAIGGGDWRYDHDTGAGQHGVVSGFGLNNVGLLVRTTGRIAYTDAEGEFFTITDGSQVQDQDGNAGVRVEAQGLALPSAGDLAVVNGVVSLSKSSGVTYPVVLASQQSDIVSVRTGSISGRITAGGGSATGATVTLTPGGHTATTNSSGDYSFADLASGSYTVTPSQTGYTFTPPSRPATITSGGAVTGVDFTRQAIQGKSIRGTVLRRSIQLAAQVVQSAHPYPAYSNDTQIVTGPTGALAVAAHFTLINLEPGHATLTTRTSAGTPVQTFDQAYYSNTWSNWVSGNTMQVLLSSDWALQHYGYQIDKCRGLMDSGTASGVLMTLNPGSRTTTTGSGGTYEFTDVMPGSYTVTASEASHVVTPASIPVAMGSSDVNGLDFASYTYGGVSGTVRHGGISEGALVVESPHPYQSGYIYMNGVNGGSSCIAIRAHFTQINIAPTYDYIYIEDVNGKFIQDMSGASRSDVWSDWVPGNEMWFRLITDFADNAYGYRVDRFQMQYPSGLAVGATLTLTPGGLTATTGADGSYLFNSVAPGSYVITPSQAGYTFELPSRQVQTEAGVVVGPIDFLRH